MIKIAIHYSVYMCLCLLFGCNSRDLLFEKIDATTSGITFENKIEETVDANYFQYMYMYIGGGVAAADFNNDGLEDLFFVSNTYDNKLYLNKGDMRFEDITQQAGITKRAGFDVGAAIADVNGDGFLDIYITRGGWKSEDNKFANMLYINNGIQDLGNGSKGVTFSEKAAEFGLDDNNRGIAASFFDYDNDGDLDVYISNAPDFEDKDNIVRDLSAIETDPKTIAIKGSDNLYQNDGNNHFTNVSLNAGIMPDLGFGLSPQVGDVNSDGWLDIYVCNDFRMPDFMYINQKNGTFKDMRNECLQHMSFNSMGADIGDINNDGFMDLFSLDMNPEDYVRARTTMGMTSTYQFNLMVAKNYHHQYMHNMLQLNNGDGTFSEIANMAGVANTDWSWSCLFADFDLDGYNDIYVSNGVFKDVIDHDVNNEILKQLRSSGQKPTPEDLLSFAQKLPQQKLDNYFFRNKGNLTFENMSQTWTTTSPTFSNGATYADLDNDGDLDLIVSNINEPPSLLKNNAIEQKKGNFLKVDIRGTSQNPQGIGTTVKIHQKDGETQTRQLITTRGFLSSVSPILHFGLKPGEQEVEVDILWNDGKIQKLTHVKPNQTIKINYANAQVVAGTADTMHAPLLFTKVQSPFKNKDSAFDDFDIQDFLPYKLSQTGPALAKGDANGDGFDDVYFGGAHGQAGSFLMSDKKGGFLPITFPDFVKDKEFEDVAATFFDADGDGHLDLYVGSGSYEFHANDDRLVGRLYMNDGLGNFSREYKRMPEIAQAVGAIAAADFDNDGDVDIFIGSRMVPGQYPLIPVSYLLINKQGVFEVATTPELQRAGMITDAVWDDIDNDQDLDLIVTGEWMGINVFENNNGQLLKSNSYKTLSETVGWWNKIYVGDVNGDGYKDIVAGNWGLNSKYKARREFPFHVYVKDFNGSGTLNIILASYYNGKLVPVQGRTRMIKQVPMLSKQNYTFAAYASKDLNQLFGSELNQAIHYEANEFRSGIFINKGKNNFAFNPFNNYCQTSCINSILYDDFDKDGTKDLLMAGNNYETEVETTRNDSGMGLFLKGQKDGSFQYIPNIVTGFWAKKDVRNMVQLRSQRGNLVVVANNNDYYDFYYLNNKGIVP